MVKKVIEKIIYSLGVSFSFYDVSKEVNSLKNNLPKDYLNRDVVDIGCGDGKTSMELKKILSPKTFTGVDTSKALIKNAKKRGLEAKAINVEEGLSGDLGILWGVVHHLENPILELKKINENFDSLIIRESVDDKRIFELGHKFNKEKLLSILEKADVHPNKIIEVEDNKSLIVIA